MKSLKHYYKYLFAIILSFLLSSSFAQNAIENDTFKYWQPNTKVTQQDFKAVSTSDFTHMNQKYCLNVYSYFGIHSILDVPKKKKERGQKLEKIYIAPYMNKYLSVSKSTDSSDIAKEQVLFDITELFARKARKKLKTILDDSKHAYGIYWSIYSSIISDMCMSKNKVSLLYLKEVIYLKTEGAYEKWRKDLDQLLDELKEFATTPEDCRRFMKDKPLSEDYIMSPNYAGEIKCDN